MEQQSIISLVVAGKGIPHRDGGREPRAVLGEAQRAIGEIDGAPDDVAFRVRFAVVLEAPRVRPFGGAAVAPAPRVGAQVQTRVRQRDADPREALVEHGHLEVRSRRRPRPGSQRETRRAARAAPAVGAALAPKGGGTSQPCHTSDFEGHAPPIFYRPRRRRRWCAFIVVVVRRRGTRRRTPHAEASHRTRGPSRRCRPSRRGPRARARRRGRRRRSGLRRMPGMLSF
mmetsp:Transcript_11140/g.45127  ORF Transcript_11140/g.45127 Transcript_11140/m.45127 type:complete len:228 (+) Transcript_11140:1822-2505(+)